MIESHELLQIANGNIGRSVSRAAACGGTGRHISSGDVVMGDEKQGDQ
jgi:hypothetical protein